MQMHDNGDNQNEHDKLWELLGKAKQPPTVSPFFVRNVLRAVREEKQSGCFFARGWLAWNWQRTGALIGACGAVAIFFSVLKPAHDLNQQSAAPSSTNFAKNQNAAAVVEPLTQAQEIAESPDYEVIAHLDDLAANEENSLWLDDSTNEYLD